jgi:hypothetical protein
MLARRFLPVVLALAMLPGCGGRGGTDAGADAPPDLPGDLPADVPGDVPDAPADLAADTPADLPPDTPADPGRDLPPLPPVFEAGLVAPLDSIPCTDDAGNPTNSCNHHGSSVAVDPDGTVLAVWYSGRGEYSPDSRIVWSRLPPGVPRAWTPWETLFDEPDIPEGNPVIHVDDRTGEWWMFFVTVHGTSWNDGILRMIRSADRGAHWSAPVTLRDEKNWMFRNRPIRLSNGEVLVPCYDETLFVPTYLVSADGFTKAWEQVSPPEDRLIQALGQIQPTVIERPDASLFALMRNGNVLCRGAGIEVTSTDRGRTWSDPACSAVPNPGGAMEMTRLPSGAVALAFDNSPTDRQPLAVALSDDHGATWAAVGNVLDACDGGSCGYPSIAGDPTDGSAWVTYTHNRRTIGFVHVSEAWVRQKNDALATIPAAP